MSERRPHWDDELIFAVMSAAGDGGHLFIDDIYAVIAAVEDWQEREKTRCKSDRAYHCATHDTQWLDDESDRCEYKRMVDAEAKIKRVREWCELRYIPLDLTDWQQGFLNARDEVQAILDGGDA